MVQDLGCRTGFDTLLAAKCVGENSTVIEIVLTPEMLARACQITTVLGMTNLELTRGEIEALPLPDASVDLVLSHGVFNVDAGRMRRDGHRLFLSANGVWLTDVVPPRHLCEM